jgi:hypothetical protein
VFGIAVRLHALCAVALGLASALVCVAARAQAPAEVAASARAPAARPYVLLTAARVVGVDPVVGRAVDAASAQALVANGFVVSTPEQGNAALQGVSPAQPATVADLWRATYAARADYGVMFQVSAEAGRYVLQVQVAARDGRGPFRAQADSDVPGLSVCVAQLLARTLPSATSNAAPNAAPNAASTATPTTVTPARAPAPTAAPEPEFARLHLAVQTESAVGFSEDGFFNQLAGGRVDYRLTPGLSLGAYLGYANLRGRGGRVGSALYYFQLEQRIPLTANHKLSLPVRFDVGYLIHNGSVLRVASGLAIALGQRCDLVFDLMAPTFWLTPERSLFSLDFAVELGVTF